jgi:hypothetical protein
MRPQDDIKKMVRGTNANYFEERGLTAPLKKTPSVNSTGPDYCDGKVLHNAIPAHVLMRCQLKMDSNDMATIKRTGPTHTHWLNI